MRNLFIIVMCLVGLAGCVTTPVKVTKPSEEPFLVIASGVNISVEDFSGFAGQTDIAVPITISNTGSYDIYSLDLWLRYDEQLIKAVNVMEGILPEGWAMVANTNLSGEVRIAIYGTSALPETVNKVVIIVFNVEPSAPEGQMSSLTLRKAKCNDAFPEVVNNGSFRIISGNSQ